MALKDWREVLETDWPEQEVTERTRQVSSEAAQKGYRTDSRIATGRIYTTKEFEAYRLRVFNTPLP